MEIHNLFYCTTLLANVEETEKKNKRFEYDKGQNIFIYLLRKGNCVFTKYSSSKIMRTDTYKLQPRGHHSRKKTKLD